MFRIHIHHHHRCDDNITHTLERLMSKISDFAAQMKTFQDKIDAAVDGLGGDIKTLNDKIDALQNSSGQITPEDQALLDEIQTRAQAAADKVSALDDMTPPAPPVENPPA